MLWSGFTAPDRPPRCGYLPATGLTRETVARAVSKRPSWTPPASRPPRSLRRPLAQTGLLDKRLARPRRPGKMSKSTALWHAVVHQIPAPPGALDQIASFCTGVPNQGLASQFLTHLSHGSYPVKLCTRVHNLIRKLDGAKDPCWNGLTRIYKSWRLQLCALHSRRCPQPVLRGASGMQPSAAFGADFCVRHLEIKNTRQTISAHAWAPGGLAL